MHSNKTRWPTAYFPAIRKWIAGIWPVILLITQNLVIFWRHYFQDYGFPWDFAQGYYALTAFWTTLVSQGTYPSWVPFFSMGMPFDLNLQSGSHYPPLWLFPLLRIEYSLHAAVVFQCLHVLFGAIGMFLFLKLSLQDEGHAKIYALTGAFIFQFFGGFYSNAEHPDIIRAFSLAPWLFYLFTIPVTSSQKVTWRILLIPLFVLLLATGAYPGNFVSSIVVIGLYFSLQLIELLWSGSKPKGVLQMAFVFFSMVVLGGILSIFHLGPAWLFREYLYRAQEVGTLATYSLGVEQLPAFFLNNAVVPGEISMTSTFVTIPALVAVTYLPLQILKKQWAMAVVLIFSALMAAGDQSFLWFALTKLTSVFQLSRFTSSDYRIFIAIGLIYFSVLSLRALIAGQVSPKSFAVRTFIVLLWFFQGIYVSYPILRSTPVYAAVAICTFSILCLAIPVFYRGSPSQKLTLTLVPFLILVAVDAYRVLPEMATWQEPSSETLYQMFNWPLKQNGHLLTYEILENLPAKRPARIEKNDYMDYSWEGYITGRYTLSNFVYSSMLGSISRILVVPVYKNFMLSEWTPLLFNMSDFRTGKNGPEIDPKSIKSALRLPTNNEQNTVRQKRYGINKIEYDVSLAHPALLVENEMYFPGWTASLASEQGTTLLQAIPVNDVFRGWYLPAGKYRMTASFEFPYIKVFYGLSIMMVIIWIILIVLLSRNSVLKSYIFG